jgi:three-Cys-motif partner protein
MAKNINKQVFTEQTQLKLDIFRECFREWFPVFLHNQYIPTIFIYDLFAGSGTDVAGNYGSPLTLLEEARGENGVHCTHVIRNNKHIVFGYNEFQKRKAKTLESNIKAFFADCKLKCTHNSCPYEGNYVVKQEDFQQLFQNQTLLSNLENPKCGKFILLDQYGFKHVDDNVFIKLTNSPKTDFIFFISSSTIKRFQESDVVAKYLKDHKIMFDETKPKECHRVIANYFRQLIPLTKEYYLHHFTIQNQLKSNYYGLIFGSNHSVGMEKFLKVCWKYDKLAGESNCNINDDFEQGTLFHNPDNTNKIEQTKQEVKELILSKTIDNNKAGMKYILSKGCLPNLFVRIINGLIAERKISIDGKFNRQVTGIHNVSEYHINIL